MVSTAQTGFFYTTNRVRLGPRLAAVKYDPVGEHSPHVDPSPASRLTGDVRAAVKSRVLFVESKKTAKK